MRTAAVGSTIMFLAALMTMSAAAWWWKTSLGKGADHEVKGTSWQRVKETYPLPPETPDISKLSPEHIEAMLQANPFSPLRHMVPAQDGGGSQGGGGASGEALAPRFVYKGRIDLGKRPRAIVEETTTHKTHFLEVGQEVAGFKVLDIAENQVVLSNLRTDEQIIITMAAPATSGSQGVGKRPPTASLAPARDAALSGSEGAAQANSP